MVYIELSIGEGTIWAVVICLINSEVSFRLDFWLSQFTKAGTVPGLLWFKRDSEFVADFVKSAKQRKSL